MKKICLVVLLLTLTLFGKQSICKNNEYYQNEIPVLTSPLRITGNLSEYCFNEFDVIYAEDYKISATSAEYLKRRNVVALDRTGIFHQFSEYLGTKDIASVSDYDALGWDKGHLLPSGDFLTILGQYQSFDLANVVPQNSNNNKGIWKAIEFKTRDLANNNNGLYVITIPLFSKASTTTITGAITIPDGMVKVIYSPSAKAGAGYYVKNIATKNYSIMTITNTEKLVGMNLFPTLSSKEKNALLPNVTLSKTYIQK
jgi:endonuclease G